MISLFTYPILGTPWLVVITDNSGHYYFNKDDKSSVWQLSDTNITDFSLRVDFNELAILVGKANGLHIRGKEENENSASDTKRQKTSGSLFVSSNQTALTEPTEYVEQDEDVEQDEEGEVEDAADINFNDPVNINSGKPISQFEVSVAKDTIGKLENHTLDLGYSSSDSEASDIESPENEGAEHELLNIISENDDSDTNDINAGLNLSVSQDEMSSVDENEDREENFKSFMSLLDELSPEISLFDPWFVVEEEVLPKVITRPEYYGVAEHEREELFNKWVVSKQSEKQKSERAKNGDVEVDHDDTINNSASLSARSSTQQSKFPSEAQLFYQYVQNHKTEIKKTYYPEFYLRHREELDDLIRRVPISHADELYRRLRVTLIDFAKREKEIKKTEGKRQMLADHTKSGEKNFKVSHVRSFLEEANVIKGGKCLAVDTGNSAFDRWVQICNHYNIPNQIANSPTNFILGDEKRLQCYKEYFNLE